MLARGYSRRAWVIALVFLGLSLILVESFRIAKFYLDLTAGKQELASLESRMNLGTLQAGEVSILEQQSRLQVASSKIHSARTFVDHDPVLYSSSKLPFFGKQARALRTLVFAADEATVTGLRATDIALYYSRYPVTPGETAIQRSIALLQNMKPQMTVIRQDLNDLRRYHSQLETGLLGPLSNAEEDLSRNIEALSELVEGYERASNFLPRLLGYGGTSQYLFLLQNDTELFASGGLISSYGVITFDSGRLTSLQVEYFLDLYDRWQRQSRGEYIEPPAPLKSHLKGTYSWGLGEAGWYPDFPKTADLSRLFASKGGAPRTDGVIAIDLHFMSALLQVLGPVWVPDYGLSVSSDNLVETTLANTHNETGPNQPRRAFLASFARATFAQLFATPGDKWIELLRVFGRMGRERHLQMNFASVELQKLSVEYGFDGRMLEPDSGDYLMVVDTSVNSTKLNWILKYQIRLDVEILQDRSTRSFVTYRIDNPFPDWRVGRDPQLVQQLMLGGVYGSYLRVYSLRESQFIEVLLNGKVAGPEQLAVESNKSVVGRYFPVLPGATSSAQVIYQTAQTITDGSDNQLHYKLLVQKQAGTSAIPFIFRPILPAGAKLKYISIDGTPIADTVLVTDLRHDRIIEVVYSDAATPTRRP